MKPFDFNIHLPCGLNDLDSRLQDETVMTGISFEDCFRGHFPHLDLNTCGGNIMLLNSSLTTSEIESLLKLTKDKWRRSHLTVMVDPRNKDWEERIEQLKNIGVFAIKFHCYIQKITKNDIASCIEIALMAEKHGMVIMIDTSYGSLGMYQYDNLRLAAAIANRVTRAPIILLHSGGARCLEAMLLADATENIYLETSFTLPYYLGSSVEQDLAYAYKKIDENRIIYGSDFPYIDLNESRNIFMSFMEKWNFTTSQIEKFAIKNGMTITGAYE